MSSTSAGTPRPAYSKATLIVPDGRSGSGPEKKSQSNTSSEKQSAGAADHLGETKLGVRISSSSLLSDNSAIIGSGGNLYSLFTPKNGRQIDCGY